MAKKGKPKGRRVWQPMTRGPLNPAVREQYLAIGAPLSIVDRIEAWGNDIYQCTVRPEPMHDKETGEPGPEFLWLSVKRHDRHPIRDWRHLQQIKNEVAGPEREAMELFPAESRLVDTSNQYHLFVLPEGETFGFGYMERDVADVDDIEAFNAEERAKGGPGGARQRAFQPGLTTGKEGGS